MTQSSAWFGFWMAFGILSINAVNQIVGLFSTVLGTSRPSRYLNGGEIHPSVFATVICGTLLSFLLIGLLWRVAGRGAGRFAGQVEKTLHSTRAVTSIVVLLFLSVAASQWIGSAVMARLLTVQEHGIVRQIRIHSASTILPAAAMGVLALWLHRRVIRERSGSPGHPETTLDATSQDLLKAWRQNLNQQSALAPEVVRELESHLMDSIEAEVASGCGFAEAFARASEKLGSANSLAREFAAADPGRIWTPRVVAVLSGILCQIAAFILCSWVFVGLFALLNSLRTPSDPLMHAALAWLQSGLLATGLCTGILFCSRQAGGMSGVQDGLFARRGAWLAWIPMALLGVQTTVYLLSYMKLQSTPAAPAVIGIQLISCAASAGFALLLHLLIRRMRLSSVPA